MPTVAESVFEKQLRHSEPDRQEYIQQTARRIEQDIYARLMTDDAEASEIGGLVAVNLTDFEAQELVRYALRKDANGLLQFTLMWIDEAVKQTAHPRAIRHVESMTPEEFEPN